MIKEKVRIPVKILVLLLLFIILAVCFISLGYSTDFKYSYSGYKAHKQNKINLRIKNENKNIKADKLQDEKSIIPPSGLNAKAVNYNEVILNWQEAAGADSYVIYRSENSDGNFQIIGTIVKPDFKDTNIAPGITYYYKISSVKNSKEGEKSKEAVITLAGGSGTGNSKANITNDGFYAKEGNWIFFSNNADNRSLYKSKTDGSQLTKLLDMKCHSINVLNGWVYFIGSTLNEGIIYKIKTDGTNLTKLSEAHADYINVAGEWIYYANSDSRLYKMKVDGSGNTKLNNEATFDVIVDGDWIYYTGLDRGIRKIKTDGTQHKELSSDYAQYINVEEGWLYYVNFYDNDRIYKIRTDGSGKTKVCDDTSEFGMIVENGWIYYINKNDGRRIYGIKTDGTGRTYLVRDTDNGFINKIDNFIYYSKMYYPYIQQKIDIKNPGKYF